MQLLDSCALPEAQFATLTILLQLDDLDDSQHDSETGTTLLNDEGERGRPEVEENDCRGVSDENIDCENEDDEADKSAGSPNNPQHENEFPKSRIRGNCNSWTTRQPKRRTQPLTHAVLRESMTVISPTTVLPEGAHFRSMESLQIHLMEKFGFRDDFRGIGGPPSDVNRDNEKGTVDNEDGERGESKHDQHNAETNSERGYGGQDNGRNERSNSRVRFHTDTKEGSLNEIKRKVVSEENASSSVGNRNMMEDESTPFQFENQLRVECYSPPSFHLNCSLGLTLFYVAVFVENIDEFSSEDGKVLVEDGHSRIEKDSMKTLKQCAAVLLPNVSWLKRFPHFAASTEREKRGGLVILTVGITGPAYDLYGASPVIATLPQRLRETVGTLSALNTVSPSNLEASKNLGKQAEQTSRPQQQQHVSPKRSLLKTKSKPSSKPKDVIIDPSPGPSQQQTSHVTYNHSYFRQLYSALLASILNDDDGYLAIGNIAPSNSSDFRMPEDVSSSHKIDGSVHSQQSLPLTIDSESTILSNPNTRSSGAGKRKLFTFSRKRNSRLSMGYETGDSISSAIPHDKKDYASDALYRSDRSSSQVQNAAEMVERMSLQLEVLSLAEEDMALPLYSKYKVAGGMASLGSGDHKRLLPSRSPKTPQASHGGTAHTSGRFGKLAAPSDLSGFDFKPKSSSSQQNVMNSAGSVGGTSSTSVMGSSSDDASILTGNDAATTSSKFTASSSSQSSVPTLSKPKRDMATTSSRSRFVQRRKAAAAAAANPTWAGSEANASPSKPPLFPHERQTALVPLFDPFGVEEDGDIRNDISKENNNDSNAKESVSIASVSTNATPTSASSPTSPSPRIDGTISYSFSGDGSDAGDGRSISQDIESGIKESLVHLDVDLALNEDLTCEYKKSKLSTLVVEGTLQVRVKSTHRGESPPQSQAPIPFFLVFQDQSSHIKALQENKKFVEHLIPEEGVEEREFIYSVSVPREDEFFPIVRYKCSSVLRPVPIRVQSRIRAQDKSCRVALQISSNPQNPSGLAQLTIIMSIPKGVLGKTLRCNPPGGVWNEEKQVVVWCVSELGGGEKFQLQAVFDTDDTVFGNEGNLAEILEFPVLARCQCSGAQLSNVAFEVTDMPDMYPADVSKSLIRRFRVSHKEK
ncbi:hypothetical protein ACHAXS_006461 [Conticribra weissflogii]